MIVLPDNTQVFDARSVYRPTQAELDEKAARKRVTVEARNWLQDFPKPRRHNQPRQVACPSCGITGNPTEIVEHLTSKHWLPKAASSLDAIFTAGMCDGRGKRMCLFWSDGFPTNEKLRHLIEDHPEDIDTIGIIAAIMGFRWEYQKSGG
jgi:hypothetical protein